MDKCFIKNAIEARRKVHFCTIGKSAIPTTISIDGNLVKGLIDTGSDVSLISECVKPMFAKKIVKCTTTLKGIIPGELVVNEYSYSYCRD
jgi:Retroviral aspartyl protease.